MKLMQINSVYQNGSTGRICKQIDEEFKKAKLGESKIAYFWGAESGTNSAIKCSTNMYAKIMALKSRITGGYGFISQQSTKKLISAIDDFGPDIIHLHNIHDHTVDLEMLFDYLNKKEVILIWTFHDCWAYTGYCAHYSMARCNRWTVNCKDCPLSHRYSWFKDKSKVLQDKKKYLYGDKKIEIITPSEWLATEVKKSFLRRNNITVINNGIDLSVFKPSNSTFRAEHKIIDKKIILGVAYQWDNRKGIDVFLRLSEIISRDYVIVLVGNISNEIKALPNNIIHIKRTASQKELAEIYTAADVFANPTREEVFGLVNIESLACGTPVVTFNSGGSPECIDATCGIVCEKEDAIQLYDHIVDICENRRFKSENCVKRARKFESSLMYKRYLEKYVEVMQR